MTATQLGIALRTYLLPLPWTRAFRFSVLGVAVVYLVAMLIRMIGRQHSGEEGELSFEMARALLMPGVPVFALLVSELPLREGLRHRTLLYPLLGPASRDAIALARAGATAVLFGLVFAVVVAGVAFIGGVPADRLGSPLLATFLGGMAYVSIFGFLQLLVPRGLAAGMLWYFLLDEPIAKIPFELCRLSVAYHVRVLGHDHEFFGIPVSNFPAEQPTVSVLFLLGVTIVALLATVALFRRRNLEELC
ncbi:MAG TPA: hypothetical protein VF720_05730 [Candidatus Eisenbacteria bacterium]